MLNPYQVVHDFEAALCEYTGAPYVVAVNSCTMALLLAVKWCLTSFKYNYQLAGEELNRPCIEIPKYTYVSVPQSIYHAGGYPTYRDDEWLGAYQLRPLPVFDSAREFTSGMYYTGTFQCVSFHASKTLGDVQGGAILHDNPRADIWFRRMRFDGRTEGVTPKEDRSLGGLSYHCYMSPDVAARLLLKLFALPRDNKPLPCDDYPDLSKIDWEWRHL